MSIFHNGLFIKDNASIINIYDLGFNRGHAVFDYFRFTNNKPRFLNDHLNRLMTSIKSAKIDIELTKAEAADQIKKLIASTKFKNGSIRFTVTAGNSSNFSKPENSGNYFIVASKFKKPSEKLYKLGANLISRAYKREFPEIKTTNYAFAQMNLPAMATADAVDILYYDDYIRESSRANIFLVQNSQIHTPKEGILKGITRKQVLQLFPNTQELDIRMDRLKNCSEVFITSSSKEIMPVVKIDEQIIGDGEVGPVTREAMEKFSKLIRTR